MFFDLSTEEERGHFRGYDGMDAESDDKGDDHDFKRSDDEEDDEDADNNKHGEEEKNEEVNEGKEGLYKIISHFLNDYNRRKI